MRLQADALPGAAGRAAALHDLGGLETIFLAVCEDRIDARWRADRPFSPGRSRNRASRPARYATRSPIANSAAAVIAAPPTSSARQLQALRDEQLFTTAYRHTIVGLVHRQQGQLAEAERTFRAGGTAGGAPSAVLVAAFLARSLDERDAVDEAQATLAGRFPVVDEACYHEAVLNAYRVAVRIAALQGDRVETARLIDHVELLAHERAWRRLLAQCAGERLRLGLLQTMDLDEILPRCREEAAIA